MPNQAYPIEYIERFRGMKLADLALTHAMRYLIRDMGNGVLRAFAPVVMPLALARAKACLPMLALINPPNRAALRDLNLAALSAMGILDTERMRCARSELYASVVDDATLEVLGWFAQSGAMML